MKRKLSVLIFTFFLFPQEKNGNISNYILNYVDSAKLIVKNGNALISHNIGKNDSLSEKIFNYLKNENHEIKNKTLLLLYFLKFKEALKGYHLLNKDYPQSEEIFSAFKAKLEIILTKLRLEKIHSTEKDKIAGFILESFPEREDIIKESFPNTRNKNRSYKYLKSEQTNSLYISGSLGYSFFTGELNKRFTSALTKQINIDYIGTFFYLAYSYEINNAGLRKEFTFDGLWRKELNIDFSSHQFRFGFPFNIGSNTHLIPFFHITKEKIDPDDQSSRRINPDDELLIQSSWTQGFGITFVQIVGRHTDVFLSWRYLYKRFKSTFVDGEIHQLTLSIGFGG